MSVAEVISIVDWGKHYENHTTRELKRTKWVGLHNKLDDEGYITVVDHPNGPGHFAVWCTLLEVASRGKIKGEVQDGQKKYDAGPFPHGRGLLIRENGEPHDAQSLSRLTRLPAALISEALPRLVSAGWVRICEISALDLHGIGTTSAHALHPTAEQVPTDRRGGAEKAHTGPDGIGLDLDTKEGEYSQSTSNRNLPPPVATHELENQAPRNGAALAELRTITPSLTLSGGDTERLQELCARETWSTVVAVYRLYQRKKPGKAFRFFLDDFGEYKLKLPKPREPPRPHDPVHQPTSEDMRAMALTAARMNQAHRIPLTELQHAAVNYSDGKPLTDHERDLLGLQTSANTRGAA
jgi:hypothetical protein